MPQDPSRRPLRGFAGLRMHHEKPSREAPPRVDLKSILVPVDGSPASMDAVNVACMVGKRTKARIYVVHVIEVRRSLPLDAELQPEAQRGEEILAKAEDIAGANDCEVEAELLQAREAYHAIVDEAAERGVDAIILGIGYKREFGEFQLGRTSNYVLKHAPCQVWLCRQSMRD